MARPRKSAADSLMQSEEFIEIALSSVEREIEATRDRLRRLADVADQLRQRRSAVAPAPVAAPAPAAAAVAGGTARRRRKHNMSAEARKKLSDRMRRRWDEYRKGKTKAAKGK